MSDGRVRYARNGDVHLAYRLFGDGDVALVWVPGWVSNVDLYDDPAWVVASVVESLARTPVWWCGTSGVPGCPTR